MAEPVKRLVIDLSHHNTIESWSKIRDAGIRGVIHKCSQGDSFADKEYPARRKAALDAGLLWGAYHFGDGQDVEAQVDWFLQCAQPDDETLLCLDWEDNPGSGGTMTLDQARTFLRRVHEETGQLPVLYSGNKAKEALGSKVDTFFGSTRLWLAQYGSSPTVQASWETYWLWQYSDGGAGPEPKNCPGVKSPCDTNSFARTPAELAAEWALAAEADAAEPATDTITITIQVRVPRGASVAIATEPQQ